MSAAAWIRRNIVYPLWVAKDRSPRLRYLRELERSQYYDAAQLRALQLQKLQTMLQHAYDETTYYKQLFDDIGLKPADIKTESDLKKIPLLGKDQVRHDPDAFLARSLRDGYLSEFKTGGSTGKPVAIRKDPYTIELGAAAGFRAARWAGWNIGEPWGLVWGNPPVLTTAKEKLRDLLLSPEIFLDTMRLNDDAMHEFVAKWARTKPTIMRGHSHSIYIFASFCKAHGIRSVRPNAIISSSMMLLPSERKIIEEAFACKVTDLYGCEEVGLIASECEQHHGLHIDMENTYVEILNPDGSDCAPGEDGAVVVTSLINRSMPLIRYKMGDVASFSDRQCACGRTLRLLNGVAGRVADFLVRKDGSVVAGVSLVERTLTKFPGIAQLQMIQEDIDNIVLKVVRDIDYNDHTEREIIAELKRSVGEHNQIKIDFVDTIPQEKNGKFRFAISKIANPFGI